VSRLPGLVGASVALLLALPSTAVAQVSERSVVFTSDPSRALVIERDAGLLPLIEAASDVLPLAVAGLAEAETRYRSMARLLASARSRQRSAAAALLQVNRMVADIVRDADRMRSTYDDVFDGLSETSRRQLRRGAHTRSNRSAVVRQITSADWVCPIGARTKFRDTWGAPRSGGRSHEGVDLVGKRHDPILAPVAGAVSYRWDSVGGRSFDLVAADGDYYYGAHLSAYGREGEVEAGDVIGYMGDSGNAQGVHLHFEYHPGGAQNAVNPYPLTDAHCTDRAGSNVSLYD
jgi:murein DD-endopeptidase MepM/ murein hydrolase activator NlpD